MTSSATVFLVGAQRSGTTALASALNAAYARAGRTFTVNGKLPYLLDRWVRQSDLDARHLRSDEIAHALQRRTPYGAGAADWLARANEAVADAARTVAADTDPPRRDDLVRAIVTRAYGCAGGWGDKYNEYLFDLGCLAPFTASARLLLLVRDPAEVAASMIAWRPRRDWVPPTPQACQAKWVTWHERFLAHPLTARVPLLVVDHARMWQPRVLARIAAFCELDTVLPVPPTRVDPRGAAPERTPQASALWARLQDLGDGSNPPAESPTAPATAGDRRGKGGGDMDMDLAEAL